MNNKHIFNDNSNSDNIVSLTVLLKKLIAVSIEAKRVTDAINKQKNEVRKQQEEVKNLLDRIVAEIESESECAGRWRTVSGFLFGL